MEHHTYLLPYRQVSRDIAPEPIPDGVIRIQANTIWDFAERGKGIKIAVIDTGVDREHPDLKSAIIGGKNFTDAYQGDGSNFSDDEVHGTHVAGILAANGKIQGVAPEAKLLILKALRVDKETGKTNGKTEWIIDAIRYAIDQRVNIISMSVGSPKEDPVLHQVIREAVERGILVVCAAGNRGDLDHKTIEYDFPAAFNESISVGAIGPDLKSPYFTNSNSEVDLVAPGVKILSTLPGGKYGELEGTSMAAPHVTGALALLIPLCRKVFERNLTETELYAQLIRRTVPLGYPASLEGNGLLDLSVPDRLQQANSTP
ncbi:S8 family peptidase [Bacillus sp. FSL L8-0152]